MDADISNLLFKFLIAISLGALMGIERDGSWLQARKGKAASRSAENASKKFGFIKAAIPADGIGGVRTYTLISILGAVSGLAYLYGIKEITWVLSAGLVIFIHISFVLNYFDKNSFGLTTEISIILNYVLSLLLFATDIPVKFIVAITVIDIIVLSMKSQSQNIVKQFSRQEIVDTVKFLLFTIVILPFLPDVSYGIADIPLAGDAFAKIAGPKLTELSVLFNPHQVWLVVVFIMGLNFAGYFATKTLGKGRGLGVVGLLGGLISSTAVTEAMALQSKKIRSPFDKDKLVEATLLANLTSFIRVVLIAVVINTDLGKMLTWPMLVMASYLLLYYLYSSYRGAHAPKRHAYLLEGDLGLNFQSPFALLPAVGFSALFLGVTIFTRIALYYLGDSGFIVSTMISAMSGMDAVTISTANLVGGSISLNLALLVLVIAACVNLVIKIVFAMIGGDPYFRTKLMKLFLFDIALGILATLFVIL